MPLLNCTTPAVAQKMEAKKSCGKIYITKLAFGSLSDVDKASTTVAAGTLSALGATAGDFQEISTKLKQITLTWDYTRENGLYDYSITIDLNGETVENREAVLHAQSICDLAFLLYTSDCQERFGGADYIVDELKTADVSTLSGHNGSIGGDDESTNIVVFSWQSLEPMLYSSITPANWPLPA